MKNPDDLAFPICVSATQDAVYSSEEFKGGIGMTLRDYFAARAMHAFICTPTFMKWQNRENIIVKASYELADKMIKERKNWNYKETDDE